MIALICIAVIRFSAAFLVGKHLSETDAHVGTWLCFAAMVLAVLFVCLHDLEGLLSE